MEEVTVIDKELKEELDTNIVTEAEKSSDIIVNETDIARVDLPISTSEGVVFALQSDQDSEVNAIVDHLQLTFDSEENVDGEPPQKRVCLAQHLDGKTYFLALSEGEVNVLVENDETNTTSGTLFSIVKSPRVKDLTKSTNTPARANSSTKDSSNPSERKIVNQSWFTTKEDKEQLKDKGVSWKRGQWSKEENLLLEANIETYCKERGFTDPADVIFKMTKDERKDFYRVIAKGLQRPLFAVYRRVLRMYDSKNHVGKYTEEEIEKLKELRKKYNSDWVTIGYVLGRSPSSVKDRCRLMKETCNSGKWQPDEEDRLAEAVYEQTGLRPGSSITQNVSWSSVAALVKTRTEKQCRSKWLNILNWKQKGGSEWLFSDDITLINKVKACADAGIQDEASIDWEAISEGWSSARSPQWLRGKWWAIKRNVPNYQMLTFREIVACLGDNGENLIKTVFEEGELSTENTRKWTRSDNLESQPATDASELHSAEDTAKQSTDDSAAGVAVSYEILQSSDEDGKEISQSYLVADPLALISQQQSLDGSSELTQQIIIKPDSAVHSNENVIVQSNTINQLVIDADGAISFAVDNDSLDAAQIGSLGMILQGGQDESNLSNEFSLGEVQLAMTVDDNDPATLATRAKDSEQDAQSQTDEDTMGEVITVLAPDSEGQITEIVIPKSVVSVGFPDTDEGEAVISETVDTVALESGSVITLPDPVVTHETLQ